MAPVWRGSCWQRHEGRVCPGRGPARLAAESSRERGHAPGACGASGSPEGALKSEGSHTVVLWLLSVATEHRLRVKGLGQPGALVLKVISPGYV